MRLNILLLFLFIALGILTTYWLDHKTTIPLTQPHQTEKQTLPAKPVPDFSVTDINGQNYSISDFSGKIVLLNFWASWCAPCVVEFPKLVELTTRHKDVVLIALSSDIDQEKINAFLIKQPDDIKAKIASTSIIIAKDNRGTITKNLFQTYKLPETILIDRQGRMVQKIIGDTDWLGKDFEKTLSGL